MANNMPFHYTGKIMTICLKEPQNIPKFVIMS